MSEAFPRGGVSGGSSAADAQALAAKAKAGGDALFGTGVSRAQARMEVVKSKSKKGGSSKQSGGGGKKSSGLPSVAGLSGGASDNTQVGLGHTRPSANNKTIKIDPVVFAKYTPGTVALGYVLQITDSRAVISLPGGVVGTVELAEVSDVTARAVAAAAAAAPEKRRKLNNATGHKVSAAETAAAEVAAVPDLRALLKPMQPVRCYVLGIVDRGGQDGNASGNTSGKKGLALSLRSSLLNRHLAFKHLLPDFPVSGCIVSKEDHGFVVSAGVGGVSFFLPSKAVHAALGDLVVGEFVGLLLLLLLLLPVALVAVALVAACCSCCCCSCCCYCCCLLLLLLDSPFLCGGQDSRTGRSEREGGRAREEDIQRVRASLGRC